MSTTEVQGRTCWSNGRYRGHVSPGKVPDTQCSFLKFPWWEDSDISKGIIDYEMMADVFGGSSPSCSNFALRKTAICNEELYGKDIVTILETNFQVDDMLARFLAVEEAITVIQQVKDQCSNRGFNQTKFISNTTTVLKSISDDSQRTADKNEELAMGFLPEDKALLSNGMQGKIHLGLQ